mmetsp:Transcript_35986/g.60138  ORF Transcript_35986/g.60138 Transcript_35986/m.60138 type:complete len:83 (+) Transcript_35986:151-399(+)
MQGLRKAQEQSTRSKCGKRNKHAPKRVVLALVLVNPGVIGEYPKPLGMGCGAHYAKYVPSRECLQGHSPRKREIGWSLDGWR